MVKPGESPATFNPNPKKMSRLGNAKLYFPIGVPFEKIWLSRIQAIQPNLKIVPLSISNPKGKSLDIPTLSQVRLCSLRGSLQIPNFLDLLNGVDILSQIHLYHNLKVL